ncbi:MAG: glycosyltransferase family 2 protein [Legionella sp.]|nr:glycosyltransferase family 2 protein [Legionella sp.]
MLTVIIIAKNEEARIRQCLKSVQFADEIIVLDSGSIDNTMAIASEYTVNVYSTDWPGYGIQKQRALDKVRNDWVLSIDADEVVTDELQEEIKQVITQDQIDAYRVPIRMHFYNKTLKYSWCPKRHIRLFKKAHARFSEDMVHEKIILSSGSRIGKLKNYIRHNSFKDIRHALYKINQYSSYSAKIRIETNSTQGFISTVIGTGWMFVRCFILQRGFLDGKRGLLFALFSAQGTFYRGIKQIYRDKD